jgi:hypothetical protein
MYNCATQQKSDGSTAFLYNKKILSELKGFTKLKIKGLPLRSCASLVLSSGCGGFVNAEHRQVFTFR